MKKLSIILLSLSLFIFINCGNSKSNSVQNEEAINVKQHFEYFRGGHLKEDINTTMCFKGLYGDSYQIVIDISTYDKIIRFYTDEYRLEDCSGDPIDYTYSAYSYELGNESSDTKRLEIALTNISYNSRQKDFEVESMVSEKIFGKIIINQPFYTSVVASGNIRKEKIRIGFARSTVNNDGSSPEKRANDTTLFSNAKLYFSED